MCLRPRRDDQRAPLNLLQFEPFPIPLPLTGQRIPGLYLRAQGGGRQRSFDHEASNYVFGSDLDGIFACRCIRPDGPRPRPEPWHWLLASERADHDRPARCRLRRPRRKRRRSDARKFRQCPRRRFALHRRGQHIRDPLRRIAAAELAQHRVGLTIRRRLREPAAIAAYRAGPRPCGPTLGWLAPPPGEPAAPGPFGL